MITNTTDVKGIYISSQRSSIDGIAGFPFHLGMSSKSNPENIMAYAIKLYPCLYTYAIRPFLLHPRIVRKKEMLPVIRRKLIVIPIER